MVNNKSPLSNHEAEKFLDTMSPDELRSLAKVGLIFIYSFMPYAIRCVRSLLSGGTAKEVSGNG